MIKIERTNRFKKELNLMGKRGCDLRKFVVLLDTLVININKGLSKHSLLSQQYCLHKLTGEYKDSWECHIEPNWLLVFTIEEKILRLERTGTHSDLFK